MATTPNPPSKPDIPPPIREREVETPVELPDPNRDAPKPDNDSPTGAGHFGDSTKD